MAVACLYRLTTVACPVCHQSGNVMLAVCRIARAVERLRRGGIIAYPTEAVWGFGCDPFDGAAVQRIFRLKARPANKPLLLVCAGLAQAQPWLVGLPAAVRATVEASWPGPVTWVLPNNGIIPPAVTGGLPTVALRVSAHPVVVALCRAFGGPVVSTSANKSGYPPCRSQLAVQLRFGLSLDDIVPGQLGVLQQPSAIYDALSGRQLR